MKHNKPDLLDGLANAGPLRAIAVLQVTATCGVLLVFAILVALGKVSDEDMRVAGPLVSGMLAGLALLLISFMLRKLPWQSAADSAIARRQRELEADVLATMRRPTTEPSSGGNTVPG